MTPFSMQRLFAVLFLTLVSISIHHAFQFSRILKLSVARSNLHMSTVVGTRDDLRNVAIIAHVDHGKTTLVDSMLRQSGGFRANQEVQSMDSNDQERERGITILAKNAAIMYKGTKINLIDTPGHADFGGEVERIMNMVDGVLLVVDSVDGPKPQTRFVLKKALEQGVKAIVVVNKIDRPQARPDYVVDRVFDLFADLNARDDQMDFQVVYASGINGIAGLEPSQLNTNLTPLFDEILKLPKAVVDEKHPLQLLIANIDYDEFKGKMGIGRIVNGEINAGEDILYGKPNEEYKKAKINEIFVFNNVGREKVTKATAGDIVMVTGIADINIGDTIMNRDTSIPLPPIAVEEPTVRMTIGVNKSPLAGREGKNLQTRVIRDRLFKELEKNVALRVMETDSADTYEVCGRGQLHLTVLIENMRREGFELFIGPPSVIEKVIDGEKCEPFESVDITVPNDYASSVVDILNKRKGEMLEMGPAEGSEGQTLVRYLIPTRGMIGVRSQLLTATKGTMIMDAVFDSYRPLAGPIAQRERGSLLSFESGVANTFGITGAQDRGRLFIGPKDEVYEDMIIGVHQRPGDLAINVCKMKQLTNMRASGSDDTIKLTPPLELNLDIAVEYIQDDELVEVTPTKVRMLKHPEWKEWAKRRKAADGK
jgi:GTP-binding protein